MGTALIYLLVVVVVAAVVYALVVAVFGRGEELPPLPEGETPTRLPVGRVSGADVRALRIPQAVRGYRMAEVDWVLDRLAGEVERLGAERDEMEARLRTVEDREAGTGPVPVDTPTGGWVLPGGERPPGRHSRSASVTGPTDAVPAAVTPAWTAVPAPDEAPEDDSRQDPQQDSRQDEPPPEDERSPAGGSVVGAGGHDRGAHRAQDLS